jgi:hypothetical protein
MSDPIRARRSGMRRLRVATASLVAAAVIGTGTLTWSLAGEAAADTTNGTAPTASDDTSSSDSTAGDPTTSTRVESSDSDHAHASSGGS